MNTKVGYSSRSVTQSWLQDCAAAEGPRAQLAGDAPLSEAEICDARRRPREFHPAVARALKAPARPNGYTNPQLLDPSRLFDRQELLRQGFFKLLEKVDGELEQLEQSKNLEEAKSLLHRLLGDLNKKRSMFPEDRQVDGEIQKVLSYMYGVRLGVLPPEEWDLRSDLDTSRGVDMECYYAFMQEVFFSSITFPCVSPWQLDVLARMISLRTGDDTSDLVYLEKRLLPLFVGLPPQVPGEHSEADMRQFLAFVNSFIKSH